MKTIMVVDDERDIRDSLGGILADEGFSVAFAESAEEALAKIPEEDPDLVLLDIWLPGMDGIDALKEIKALSPHLPVVMITGHGTVETAVRATKIGAYDFLEKPLSIEKVVLTIEHALEQSKLLAEKRNFVELERESREIIGVSRAVSVLKEEIKRAAFLNAPVLITGENGAGKEIVARNIHLNSPRSERPFIAVNCVAISREALDGALFGHERGARETAKKGKLDSADGSTLFLDEIAEATLPTQGKILRMLEEKSFERVGGARPVTVDVRVIASTAKDLREEIVKGNFREDLYQRLTAMALPVPALRERVEDIPEFTHRFLREFSKETGKEAPSLAEDAMEALLNYDWPGNVRELKNLIERLVIMAATNTIDAGSIPSYLSEPRKRRIRTLKEARKDFEKDFIIRKLEEFNGNIAKTADSIGMERSHLYKKIKSYGIET